MDVRRVIIILVIAILFSILVNVTIEAVMPSPAYNDFCDVQPRAPFANNCSAVPTSQELRDSCEGNIAYTYDDMGCPVEAYCETCGNDYDEERERYNLIVFIVNGLAGLIALFVGLYLPTKNDVNEWVGSGFLLGGIIAILIGTVRYFGDMGRWVRPVVILIELVLVIWLTYKKLGKK